MIKKQTMLFPKSGKYDYRSVITDDGSVNETVMNYYFDKDFLGFVENITKSEYSKTHTPSPYYKDCCEWRKKNGNSTSFIYHESTGMLHANTNWFSMV